MSNLVELKNRIDAIQKSLQMLQGKKEMLLSSKEALDKNIATLSKDIDIEEKAKTLLDIFAKSTERDVKKEIEPIVNETLKFVFDQNLFFHLVFVTRRNQIEVDFIIIRDQKVEKDFLLWSEDIEKHEKELNELIESTKNINYMYGGSVNQVVSLILIFSLVELLQIKGPIVLDEPTSMVDETYNSRLGQLIASLSIRFNRQYIFLTHSTALASYANKIYSVKKINHISYVKEGVE